MRPFPEIAKHPAVIVMEAGPDGGSFLVKRTMGAGPLRVIASWEMGWDHVSVSLPGRVANYHEMKRVKRIFFKPDEWAMEYHPPVADYISINDNVLHLWRPQGVEIPVPPSIMV